MSLVSAVFALEILGKLGVGYQRDTSLSTS